MNIIVSITIVAFLSIHAEGYWKPVPLTNWTWQLSGKIDTSKNVLMYDIDLWDTSRETIQALQQRGKKVICYFSAGSYEDWRADKNLFPASIKGNRLDEW